MSEIYKVGMGHDVSMGGLVTMLYQPHCPDGVQPAAVDHAADGTVVYAGLHCELIFAVVDGETDIGLLYAQFNLDNFLRYAVTVYVPDDLRNFHRYNAWAIRPRTPKFQFWGRDIRILLRDMIRLD